MWFQKIEDGNDVPETWIFTLVVMHLSSLVHFCCFGRKGENHLWRAFAKVLLNIRICLHKSDSFSVSHLSAQVFSYLKKSAFHTINWTKVLKNQMLVKAEFIPSLHLRESDKLTRLKDELG